MTICGHQFHGGDGSDWVLSTSVGCLDESTTATRILQELFKKRCRDLPIEIPKKCSKTITALSSKKVASLRKKHEKHEPEDTLIVRKIPDASSLENFDESQHLNGCPVKWLYNKRLLEKKKRFRVQRLCSEQSPRKEIKREKANNLRDRTPVEMKIHKINLMEKYTTDSDDIYLEKAERPKDIEAHKRQLAAKLNWKLHDDSQEEPPHETFSEAGSRHNYFPPRPLLGLKPLLSILMAPHKTNCCCLVEQLRGTSPRGQETRVSLSIQSLDLPLPPPELAPRPRLKKTKMLHWGSKSNAISKKLQIPNQITMKLDQEQQNFPSLTQSVKVICFNPAAKRVTEQRKHTKSLSSLFYELRGKASYRIRQNEEVIFEEMIRELTSKGGFKMKQFWDLKVENSDCRRECKNTSRGKEKHNEDQTGDSKESNPACGTIRFFRKPQPKGIKASGVTRLTS